MKISKNGINMIKQFEGLRLKPYLDTAGIKTVGYGHAYWGGGEITEAQAEELLKKDLEKFEGKVNEYSDYDWSQNEFDALVSFAYNVGSIKQLTQNGSRTKAQIADKMLEYVKSGGKRIEGLYIRRKKERTLFLTPAGTPPITHPLDVTSLAFDVIAGKYGNGNERKALLGENYSTVQNEVNYILKKMTIAEDIIQGDYGNGEERKRRLTEIGEDYAHIQKIVNYKIKHTKG